MKRIGKNRAAGIVKKYLRYIMDVETGKSLRNMNADKIGKYADRVLELEEIEVKIPEEKIKNHAKSMIEKYYNRDLN